MGVGDWELGPRILDVSQGTTDQEAPPAAHHRHHVGSIDYPLDIGLLTIESLQIERVRLGADRGGLDSFQAQLPEKILFTGDDINRIDGSLGESIRELRWGKLHDSDVTRGR